MDARRFETGSTKLVEFSTTEASFIGHLRARCALRRKGNLLPDGVSFGVGGA
jgi:hypothetical protein